MQTIMIEVEDNYCYELLVILKKLPIKIVPKNAANHKKYTKQDILNKINYQGTANDSQTIDELIYL